jgi:hypothetical protein
MHFREMRKLELMPLLFQVLLNHVIAQADSPDMIVYDAKVFSPNAAHL